MSENDDTAWRLCLSTDGVTPATANQRRKRAKQLGVPLFGAAHARPFLIAHPALAAASSEDEVREARRHLANVKIATTGGAEGGKKGGRNGGSKPSPKGFWYAMDDQTITLLVDKYEELRATGGTQIKSAEKMIQWAHANKLIDSKKMLHFVCTRKQLSSVFEGCEKRLRARKTP